MIRPLLSRDDVEAVLRALSHPSRLRWFGPCRNRALIALLAYTGVRIGEALTLRACDVTWKGKHRGLIAVQTTKSVRSGPDGVRRVQLGDGGMSMLEKWWSVRRAFLGQAHATRALFCQVKHANKSVVAIGVRRAQRMMEWEGKKCGLPLGALHPHGLRHFHAVTLMRSGMNVKKIQQLLGHADLKVTSVYLSRFGDEEALDEQAAVFDTADHASRAGEHAAGDQRQEGTRQR